MLCPLRVTEAAAKVPGRGGITGVGVNYPLVRVRRGEWTERTGTIYCESGVSEVVKLKVGTTEGVVRAQNSMAKNVVSDRTHGIVVTKVAANGCGARTRPLGPKTGRWRLITESYWVD